MSEEERRQVYPGPIKDPGKFPPPEAIDCIKVDKVYEECKQVDVNEIRVDIPDDIEDTNLINNIGEVECIDVELLKKECEIVADTKVRLWIKYEITYSLNDEVFTEIQTFEKIVVLGRAGEEGLEPQCEVFLECLDAFIVDDEIVLCIGKLLIFKLIAHVQLLVPVYGFCPQPEICQVAAECPDYDPEWPPYPPQE
ncbi:hypothetical protein [Natranaerobius thermophilus]|uniref:SipL SPOCS domain-containing protein n=1 Tax=Natranaerobius thermophilus (strain ATCC BAA-1301 / DSM 18059 / JW/NM-WN-LF) TaxID=457570 RepID=B2A794_NATTJ|nr:hypothetical protein [Natranaerobius thermophilus]ACB84288.1 hypothetical protein Nther_0696 [Natranaerobius thermophilus JW/NM-WN-LF]